MFSQLYFLVENILSMVVRLPQALLAYIRDWLHFRELANRFPGPPTRPIVGNLFDCGLFPDRNEWSLHHKIMKQSFHQNLLKTYVPAFNQRSDVFIDLLAEYANGSAFDVKVMTETLGVDIILETLLGLPSNQQTNPDQDLFKFILTGQKEIFYRLRSPCLYIETSYKISPSGRKPKENLKVGRRFLAKGFDTTAITLQFALYFLAKNPLVQEKAVRELRTICDAAGSTEVTPDTLRRMQYVEMIVKETLRLHPPIFFYQKEVGVDTPLVSCDLVVPAGAIVSISPRTLHMDPKLYPDPNVFDPERFSPENSAKRHPYAFIPFGAGMRTCMGRKFAMLVLKTVISKVIWNYRIQPDESYEPQLLWGISMVTSNGMRIKLLKR